MTSRGWLFGAAFGLLASGCVGGQSGTESSGQSPPNCNTTSRAVLPDEMTDEGSVEELAASVEHAVSIPMHVSDHEGSNFDTVLTLTTSVVRTSGVLYERSGIVPSLECHPSLTVRAILHFDTADGSFTDVFDGVLTKSGGQIGFIAELPLDKHVGTLRLTSPAQKTPILSIRTTLGSEPSGQLYLDGGHVDGSPYTDPIATWP